MTFVFIFLGAVLAYASASQADASQCRSQLSMDVYDNRNLAGNAVIHLCWDQDDEGTLINEDWGTDVAFVVPDPNAPSCDKCDGPLRGRKLADNFSIRISGDIDFEGGDYTFIVGADDGVRLYVDGQPVVDDWKPHAYTQHVVPWTLPPGKHHVVLEYFEALGGAKVYAAWQRQAP